jgi:serine/threonine protein phosphatase 1
MKKDKINGGPRVYAIGDIHGHYDKVRNLVERCRADSLKHGASGIKFIFIGDYIDRGPKSREVIEYLIDLQAGTNEEVICLKGNHEALVVAAAQGTLDRLGNIALEDWLEKAGGLATLSSYGAAEVADIPQHHIEWMASLPWRYDDGHRFFVHAGVNPAISLTELQEHDALWIREPFLSSKKNYGRLIVHGHTPVSSRKPNLRANRLNLDTAAGYGGPISAAVFDLTVRSPLGFIIE